MGKEPSEREEAPAEDAEPVLDGNTQRLIQTLRDTGDLDDAYEEAERAIDAAFGEWATDEADTPPRLDDATRAIPATSLTLAPADGPQRLSRPKDRKVEQAVGNLVRLLTGKREVTQGDLDVVLRLTAAKVVELAKAQAVAIFLCEDAERIRCHHVACSGALRSASLETTQRLEATVESLKAVTLRVGSGIVGSAVAENRSRITTAVPDDDYRRHVERSTGLAVEAVLTVPIGHAGEVFGAIQVINKEATEGAEGFTDHDIALIEEVADYSARAFVMVREPGIEWPDEDIARFVARLAKVDYIDLREASPEPKLLQLVGRDNLERYRILPLAKLGPRSVKVVTDNPLDLDRREAFEAACDLAIESLGVAPARQIDEAIAAGFEPKEGASVLKDAFIADLQVRAAQRSARVDLAAGSKEDSAPVIKLVNQIIEDGYARGASDIHIEPFEDGVVVRYRSDGVLLEAMQLPRDAIRPIIARLKIMAALDISEQRLPQDGRIPFRDLSRSGLDIDLRLATGPMIWGEKAVMRILDRQSTALGIEHMGYSAHNLERYLACLDVPYGMILHCGPTGSGKTTALYTSLGVRNTPERNIQTAEDPVEYVLRGINQMQVKPAIGLTFARAIRAYLRQDPDILMIGEIRDRETALAAIEAALTGHQVFSTLHTNDAPSTIVRLGEMGIEPFLVTGSVVCVCAQRLLRRVCQSCREPYEAGPADRRLLGVDADDDEAIELFRAKEGGCGRCNGTGYKGRIGTHELLVMNDALRAAIVRGADTAEVHRVAVEEAEMVPLLQDALHKAREGITDIAEVLRHVRGASA